MAPTFPPDWYHISATSTAVPKKPSNVQTTFKGIWNSHITVEWNRPPVGAEPGALSEDVMFYRIYRNGVVVHMKKERDEDGSTQTPEQAVRRWVDDEIEPLTAYSYVVTAENDYGESNLSVASFITTPDFYNAGYEVEPVVDGVVKWQFFDLYQKGPSPWDYVFEINPNEGGALIMEKTVTQHSNTGPNRMTVLQEGQNSASTITFSGVILDQDHFEAMEYWFQKRVMLEIRDDLGRRYRGILSGWVPQRPRRTYNFWYHTYSATFTVSAARNANGQNIYGDWWTV